MYDVRESWTDERLDDFAKHVDQRFDTVDQRFDAVDRRFDKVDREMDRRFDKVEREMVRRFDAVDHELHRVNDRLDGMHRVMVQAVLMLSGSTLASFLVLAGLILTH